MAAVRRSTPPRASISEKDNGHEIILHVPRSNRAMMAKHVGGVPGLMTLCLSIAFFLAVCVIQSNDHQHYEFLRSNKRSNSHFSHGLGIIISREEEDIATTNNGSSISRSTTALHSRRSAITIPSNDEESKEFEEDIGKLPASKHQDRDIRFYEKPRQTFEHTKFTQDDFVVAGVNLAKYGLEDEDDPRVDDHNNIPPFELFQDFDISHLLQGDESWEDLLAYRKHLTRPSLSFYADKVAQKRWMQAMGIPTPQSLALQYRSELVVFQSSRRDVTTTLAHLLTGRTNFVAQPSHKASGAWVVQQDSLTGRTSMRYRGNNKMSSVYSKSKLVQGLVQDMDTMAGPDHSWALRHVRPGIVVEERFTNVDFGREDADEQEDQEERKSEQQPDWDSNDERYGSSDGVEDDDMAVTEFEVFVIWGRAWVANWKRGLHRRRLVHRNGMVECSDQHRENLPSWVDWDRVIRLAEELAANKDFFRVDILVGVPAGSPALRRSRHEQLLDAIQYVVSETAFYPTTKFTDHEILAEGARLWIAGYKMGIYRTVPNTQVPEAFKNRNMLTEEDAGFLKTQWRGPIRIRNLPSSSSAATARSKI